MDDDEQVKVEGARFFLRFRKVFRLRQQAAASNKEMLQLQKSVMELFGSLLNHMKTSCIAIPMPDSTTLFIRQKEVATTKSLSAAVWKQTMDHVVADLATSSDLLRTIQQAVHSEDDERKMAENKVAENQPEGQSNPKNARRRRRRPRAKPLRQPQPRPKKPNWPNQGL